MSGETQWHEAARSAVKLFRLLVRALQDRYSTVANKRGEVQETDGLPVVMTQLMHTLCGYDTSLGEMREIKPRGSQLRVSRTHH